MNEQPLLASREGQLIAEPTGAHPCVFDIQTQTDRQKRFVGAEMPTDNTAITGTVGSHLPARK